MDFEGFEVISSGHRGLEACFSHQDRLDDYMNYYMEAGCRVYVVDRAEPSLRLDAEALR
jgi:hypothetical protein